MDYKIKTKNVEETINLAKNIVLRKFPNMIICLDGELGSGKTTFTKGIATALEINEVITSPTFIIMKEYLTGKSPLYHIDAYRLEGNTEGIGIEECFNKNGIVIIEWANTIKDILPKERLDITINIINEDTRELELKPYGKVYEELCEAIS